MNTRTKLGAFALVLGVAFGAAYGVGAVAGPVGGGSGTTSQAAETGDSHGMEAEHSDEGAQQAADPVGLAVAADGYALRTVAAAPGEFAFQVVGADQRPVTAFQVNHEKRLHLIVVRRDLAGFQHLHPRMDPDGTWRVPLALSGAGDWRVFADFLPVGRDQQVVLGLDVPVAGAYQPQPPITTVDDHTVTVYGYTVTVDGALTAGKISRLTLSVSKDGAAVTDLQPYLGAYGHLVALRAGDLGYLHVHPLETGTAGPEIAFDVEVPTAGPYRLFLDFQHGGVVRTAQFTASAA